MCKLSDYLPDTPQLITWGISLFGILLAIFLPGFRDIHNGRKHDRVTCRGLLLYLRILYDKSSAIVAAYEKIDDGDKMRADMEKMREPRPELARENEKYKASLSERDKLKRLTPPWFDFESENKGNHDAFERLFTAWEASEEKLRGKVLDFLIYLKESPTMKSPEAFIIYRDRVKELFHELERRLPRGDPHRRLSGST